MVFIQDLLSLLHCESADECSQQNADPALLLSRVLMLSPAISRQRHCVFVLSVHACVCPCVRDILKVVNMVSYIPLAGTSPNFHCKVKRYKVKVTVRPRMVK